jgi:hypothetical protein
MMNDQGAVPKFKIAMMAKNMPGTGGVPPKMGIWVMNSDGSGPRRITGERPVLEPDAIEMESYGCPFWMPDGRIGFLATEGGCEQIAALDADGSNAHAMSRNRDLHRIWGAISLSPDGSRIVFHTWHRPGLTSDRKQIFSANLDGTDEVQITRLEADCNRPVWSPDGSRIAFGCRMGDRGDVYLMGADGSGLVNLTGSLDLCVSDSVAWSPDGLKIAFGVERRDEGAYIMNADGTNPTRVTVGGDHIEPRWSPDGSLLVVCSGAFGANGVYLLPCDGTAVRRHVYCYSRQRYGQHSTRPWLQIFYMVPSPYFFDASGRVVQPAVAPWTVPAGWFPDAEYGGWLSWQDKTQEALPYLLRGTQKAAQATTLHEVARCYFNLGMHAKAAEVYERTIALSPDYIPAYGLYAETLAKTNKIEEAVEAARTAIALDGEARRHGTQELMAEDFYYASLTLASGCRILAETASQEGRRRLLHEAVDALRAASEIEGPGRVKDNQASQLLHVLETQQPQPAPVSSEPPASDQLHPRQAAATKEGPHREKLRRHSCGGLAIWLTAMVVGAVLCIRFVVPVAGSLALDLLNRATGVASSPAAERPPPAEPGPPAQPDESYPAKPMGRLVVIRPTDVLDGPRSASPKFRLNKGTAVVVERAVFCSQDELVRAPDLDQSDRDTLQHNLEVSRSNLRILTGNDLSESDARKLTPEPRCLVSTAKGRGWICIWALGRAPASGTAAGRTRPR